MKKGALIFFLPALILCAVRMHAQNPLSAALEEQYKEWPQERIYVHSASDEYLPGDIIWLKVYITDAQKLQNIDGSRYAYVELADAGGLVKTRKKIIARNGLYAGYLRIPEDCASGLYCIRAYTRYSEITPWNIHERPIQIGQTKALERIPDQKQETILFDVRYEDDGTIVLSVPDSAYYFIGACRMEPFFAGGIRAGSGIAFKDLPEGNVTFYALNRKLSIAGKHTERTENGQRRCSIGLKTDNQTYKKGETATILLDVSSLEAGEIADISVSVAKSHHPLGESIGRTLLDSEPAAGLDLNSVFKGNILPKPVQQEAYQALEGSVKSPWRGKPVTQAAVKLIAPKIGQFAAVVSDADGNFAFNGLDAPEGTFYVVSATDKKGSDNVVLSLKEPVYPDFGAPRFKFREVVDTINVEYGGISISETIELRGAEIRADAADPELKGVSSMADFSFGNKQIEEMDATCLHEVLRRVPGIFIKEERVYIRAVTSIYADNPAAIAIDGVIMPEEYDLDDIEMPMVDRVDVFKTGQTTIWGTAAASGLVSITTKSGAWVYDSEPRPNIQKITLLGYQPKTQFKPDYRNLYWNPSVQDTQLQFPIADVASPGLWRIVLEGVTSKGRYIHEEATIRVK
ncbi:MAG: TonB-dependent receptor plug domain-containing protein [Bacteroidales bacterium]|nr:TonB-dependent receptor plug domain-containing protein [Bacteroidales bacterium]